MRFVEKQANKSGILWKTWKKGKFKFKNKMSNMPHL